jgi:hypothetical protein
MKIDAGWLKSEIEQIDGAFVALSGHAPKKTGDRMERWWIG